MKKYLNRSLRIILFVDFLAILAASMFAPLQAVFVQDIGGDILDAGLASTAFALVAGVVVFFSGLFSDKQKKKHKLVALGYLMLSIGFFSHLFVTTVFTLFLVQAWIGMSQAFMAPAFDGLYTDNIGSQKKVSSRWGAWSSMQYFAMAIGGLFGGALVKYYGFDALFIVMGLLCLFSSFYLYFVPKRNFKS
jgi:MFS family permease